MTARLLTMLTGLGAVGAGAVALAGVPGPKRVDAGLVAHVTGLLAGYLVAVMVMLMSRAPVLERRIGPDTLARRHARGGRVFLVLVLVHAGAAVTAWADSRGENIVSALVAVMGLPGLMTAAVGTALFVVVAGVSVRAARRALSYEKWHGIHLLTYVAIALSFAHELAGPDLAGRTALQIGWSLLYSFAFGLVLRYRVMAPLLDLWRHRLRVEAVIPEADGVVSVVMRGRHVAELRAESGQFFRWRFLTVSTAHMALPFSLSAPPHGDRLRITVKALGAGTRRVHAVRPGTWVLAEGPSGAMTARRRTRPAVLLIAGGVGITPMRALFETIDAEPGRLTLLYRASRPADVVFADELRQIARRRGARIEWMIGPSGDPGNRMTAANLHRLVPGVADHDVYLCAGPALAAAVRAAVTDAGLPRRRLHEESFVF